MGERWGLRVRYRKVASFVVLVAFTAASPFVVYMVIIVSLDRMGEEAWHADLEGRARVQAFWAKKWQELQSIPKSGTTPEKVASVSIGMSVDEVQSTLGLTRKGGKDLPPYTYQFGDHHWMSNEIPIEGVGFIQAVFIDEQLVGLGSLDLEVGRLCGGGCLDNMLRGERSWLEGLPYQVERTCPVCGSEKRVPPGRERDKLR